MIECPWDTKSYSYPWRTNRMILVCWLSRQREREREREAKGSFMPQEPWLICHWSVKGKMTFTAQWSDCLQFARHPWSNKCLPLRKRSVGLGFFSFDVRGGLCTPGAYFLHLSLTLSNRTRLMAQFVLQIILVEIHTEVKNFFSIHYLTVISVHIKCISFWHLQGCAMRGEEVLWQR